MIIANFKRTLLSSKKFFSDTENMVQNRLCKYYKITFFGLFMFEDVSGTRKQRTL